MGRIGRLVVQEWLNRGVTEVVALVRDTRTAEEILGTKTSDKDDDGTLSNLQITQCDLSNKQSAIFRTMQSLEQRSRRQWYTFVQWCLLASSG
jgi:putative NADH-flavin reductase